MTTTDALPGTEPDHRITITAVHGGTVNIDWACPPNCPTPNTCPTSHAIRQEDNGLDELPPGEYLTRHDWPGGVSVYHLDGSVAQVPTPLTLPSEFTVSLLTDSDPNYRKYLITVRSTPDGWGIFHGDHTLRWDGSGWDDSTVTSGNVGEWLTEHRIGEIGDAMDIAEHAAPAVTVNGITALEAWRRSDNDRRVREIFSDHLPDRWMPRHTDTALQVLAELAGQMSPKAAREWMLTPRYSTLTGRPRDALGEISRGAGHTILDQARSRAATAEQDAIKAADAPLDQRINALRTEDGATR